MGTRVEHACVIDKNSLTTSLHFIDQCVIIFTRLVLLRWKNASSIFFVVSQNQNFEECGTHFKLFSISFKPFSLKFDTNFAR